MEWNKKLVLINLSRLSPGRREKLNLNFCFHPLSFSFYFNTLSEMHGVGKVKIWIFSKYHLNKLDKFNMINNISLTYKFNNFNNRICRVQKLMIALPNNSYFQKVKLFLKSDLISNCMLKYYLINFLWEIRKLSISWFLTFLHSFKENSDVCFCFWQ